MQIYATKTTAVRDMACCAGNYTLAGQLLGVCTWCVVNAAAVAIALTASQEALTITP